MKGDHNKRIITLTSDNNTAFTVLRCTTLSQLPRKFNFSTPHKLGSTGLKVKMFFNLEKKILFECFKDENFNLLLF
jgi:hypothetical protein